MTRLAAPPLLASIGRVAIVVIALALAACGRSGDAVSGRPAGVPGTHTELIGVQVVSSTRDDNGLLHTTIWNKDQTEVLARMTYDPTTGKLQIEHLGLAQSMEYDLGPLKVTDLADWNQRCAEIYALMPGSTEATIGYDGFGCDSVAGPASCTSRGNCCDTHDHCYSQNGCSAASWYCAPAEATCRFAKDPRIKLPACLLALTCNDADKGLGCAMCNGTAVVCFATGGTGEPSTCCANDNCGDPRPDDCNTLPNGCCSDNPNCGDPPDPPDPPPPPPPGPDDPCLDCDPGDDPGDDPSGGTDGPILGPTDPNEKIGPAGTGEDRLMSASSSFAYTILFENDINHGATVPAQEVVVVDYLHADLDWSTLAFTEINFGGRTLVVPAGVTSYEITDIPPNDGCMIFGEANGQLAVKVSLSLNIQTGRIELRLKVIDTATGDFPWDPFAGILPPDGTVCANGHISFSVRPRSDAKMGSRITNQATIVFDYEAAIDTKEVWNTIGP